MVAQARVPDSRTGTVLAPAEPAAEAALIVVLSPATIAHVGQIAQAGWDGPVLAVGSVEEARALLENQPPSQVRRRVPASPAARPHLTPAPDPPERLVRGMDRVVERMDAVIRPLNLKRFRQDVDIIKGIYNAAWSRNWGFVPMTDAEFEHMAKEFRPIVDPALCLIAEVAGEPVGFSLAIPNINRALRHLPDGKLFPFGLFRFLWHKRKIRGIRVITLGFKPGFQHSGLGAALYLRGWLAGTARGYDHGEASWILEDNLDMVRPLERMGGRVYKRYRIYERAL